MRINGDGETTRDFCFINNVVQINLLAAMSDNPDAINQIYNVALSDRTSLNQLYQWMRSELVGEFPHIKEHTPEYRDFRDGDIRHSQADITKAITLLGYAPTHRIHDGLKQSMTWYKRHLGIETLN